MNLKVLYDPREAEGAPLELFLVSFVYTLIAVMISAFISQTYSSILMVSLVVIALLPIFYNVSKLEATKSETKHSEKTHLRPIIFFVFLFLGFLAGYFTWYLLAPSQAAQAMFSTQIQTITEINAFTGNFFSEFGQVNFIFFSNFKLLILSGLLSLLFGAGAIFVLAWNASVMAVAMGSFAKDLLSSAAFYYIVPATIFRYLTHGLLEMTAYFIAGLVGSILFIELVRRRFNSKQQTKNILGDVVTLSITSVVILYIAAVIEVGIIGLF